MFVIILAFHTKCSQMPIFQHAKMQHTVFRVKIQEIFNFFGKEATHLALRFKERGIVIVETPTQA